MRTLSTITVFATSLLLAQAAAADNGLYLGGSIGQSTTDLPGTTGFDDQSSGFKVIAGLRPLDWLGVEASYIDLGEVKQTVNAPGLSDFRFDTKGFDAFGVFFLDVATFDLFAKAGVVQWDVDGSGNTLLGPIDASDDGTDFAWALGAQARFRSMSLRVEYERFEMDSVGGMMEKPSMLSVGFTWTFL